MIKTDALPAITRRRLLQGTGVLGAGAALVACGSGDEPPLPPVTGLFRHGVASGDPLVDRVIVWTRITLDEGDATPRALVRWQVSETDDFAVIAAQGEEAATPAQDWTIKVDVQGLKAGTVYYYRFVVGDATSPVGRAKTLVAGRMDRLRLAVFSCSNYPFGYFNAYRHMAEGEPVDAVLHLGDYFYEYGPDGYGGEEGEALGRSHTPARETVTLEDYRARHAQYKSDVDLQAAHAAAPWITIWDDHESTNNAYTNGAQNHQPETEGDWTARKAAAVRAYLEWMPIRNPSTGQAQSAIWRSFEFGDLASLVMLESRLTARSDEITLDSLPIPEDAADGDPAVQAEVNAFLADVVGDPGRTLLGSQQLAYVSDRLQASTAAGKPWQILGNQVIMAPVAAPNYTTDLPAYVRQMARQDEQVWAYMRRTRFNIPSNLDSWDGFPAERERLYDVAKAAGANMVVFTGDTHNFWANALQAGDGATMGYEFGTTSVSSPSPFARLKAPGLHAGRIVEAANEAVLMHEPYDNGYLIAEFTPDTARVDYVVVDTIASRRFKGSVKYQFAVSQGDDGAQGALTARKI